MRSANAIGVAMGLVQRLPKEESQDLRLPNPPSTSSSSTLSKTPICDPTLGPKPERGLRTFSPRCRPFGTGCTRAVSSARFAWSRNPPGTLRGAAVPRVSARRRDEDDTEGDRRGIFFFGRRRCLQSEAPFSRGPATRCTLRALRRCASAEGNCPQCREPLFFAQVSTEDAVTALAKETEALVQKRRGTKSHERRGLRNERGGRIGAILLRPLWSERFGAFRPYQSSRYGPTQSRFQFVRRRERRTSQSV